jgi:hypothetical protein
MSVVFVKVTVARANTSLAHTAKSSTTVQVAKSTNISKNITLTIEWEFKL